MKRIVRFVILFWLAAGAATLRCQEMRVKGFTTAEGLPSDSILCALQDTIGFFWIGTAEGLCRYDGYSFKVFRNDGSDPSSLVSNAVTSLCLDQEGYLWIGTADGKIDKLDLYNEKFLHIPLGRDTQPGSGEKSIRYLYIRPSQPDTLLIGTGGPGLIGLDRRTGKPAPLEEPLVSGGLGQADVSAIFEDPAKNLWVGTASGLWRFQQDSGSLERFSHDPGHPASLSDDRVLAISQSAADPAAIWVGTANGLSRYDTGKGVWESYFPESPASEPGEYRIKRIIEIPEYPGRLLTATDKGLFWFDTGKKSFARSDLLPPSLNDGAGVNITELALDRGKVLWVGTLRNGIFKLGRTIKGFVSHGNPGQPRQGEPDLRNINSFSETQDGRVLITNQPGQVFWYDPAGGKSAPLSLPSWLDVPGRNGPFLTSYVSRDGFIWFGTEAGAWRWSEGIERPEQVPAAGLAVPGLTGEAVYRIYEDPLGRMWFASRKGLRRFDPVSGVLTAFPEGNDEALGLSGDYIYDILVEAGGVVWIGTEGGLDMYDEDNEDVQHFIHDPEDPLSLTGVRILAIHQDGADRIWVATDAGLNLVDFSEDPIAFRHVPVDLYLPDNPSVLAVAEDGRGDLWLATAAGIMRFSPSDNIFALYDSDDGVGLSAILQGAALSTSRGDVLFGCREGFLTFRPAEFTYNLHPPAVWPVGWTPAEIPLAMSGARLVLPRKRSSFQVEFAALDFQRPERNQYTYKLEGAQDEWQMLGFKRRASIGPLPSGTYALRVRAANNDGIWNPEFLEIAIRILPPFWRTWPFALIVVGAAGLLILLILRLRAARRGRGKKEN